MRNHCKNEELKRLFESLRREVRRPVGARRVLVAVDDSEPGWWAVRAGERLAKAVEAEVVLLHVINPAAVTSPDLVMTREIDEIRAAQKQAADELLEEAHQRMTPALHVERLVLEGDAGEAIVEAAREWDAEFIVMGTRGRGRLASFLLGSTAYEVVRRARCPVLTVGNDPEGAPPADDNICNQRSSSKLMAGAP